MTASAEGPDEPTQSLTRAYAVAAELAHLPPALREAELLRACGGDAELARQVRMVLASIQSHAPDAGAESRSSGELFGRFWLLEVLGTGSTGVVHRATETNTGREVALKRLRPNVDAQAVIRLHQEALLLGQLQHPGIVQVIDAGHVTLHGRQEPYLAMELVTGPTLVDGADRLQLNLRDRAQILVALCRAVAHAHRRGIIHRDLKPHNVRLDLEVHPPLPRVLDFGVAAPRTRASAARESTIVGTLGYMAPEQADGTIDVRCDVYSLGAIAYHLLTGQRALDLREVDFATANARLRTEDPPAASRHRRELRGDLDAILAKALQRDPSKRYASADELGDEFQRWLEFRPIEARQPTFGYVTARFVRRQPLVAALGGLCTLSVVVGLLLAWLGASRAQRANAHLLDVLALAIAELAPKVRGDVAMQAMPPALREELGELVAAAPRDPKVLSLYAEYLRLESEVAMRGGRQRWAQFLRQELVATREAIATAQPSPAHRHALAEAMVLLGDIEKQFAESQRADTESAARLYRRAHDIFEQLAALEPRGRRERDDLVHSHLRIAYLDLLHDRLTAAEQRIELARPLLESLQSDQADHPYTQLAMREFLGIAGVLARKRGDTESVAETFDRALEHCLRAHQLAPNDLHIAAFLLATATSCGCIAHQRHEIAKAKQVLQLANTIGRELAERCPNHCTAAEMRSRAARELGCIALEEGNLRECFLHLAEAADLALGLRLADSPGPMADSFGDVARVAELALLARERAAPAAREACTATARLLLTPLASAVVLRPNELEWRILLTELQASCGGPEDVRAARRALDEAVHQGWFDARLWLMVSVLLEREAQVAAALDNLEHPPGGLTDELRVTAACIRSRLRGN